MLAALGMNHAFSPAQEMELVIDGAGKVSLVSAAFRWLNHHSQMKPEFNGKENQCLHASCLIPDILY